MFNALIKFIFPTIKSSTQPNYLYYEDSKKSTKEMQEQAVEELQASLQSKSISIVSAEEKHQKEFYDFLFGQSPPTEHHDELSLFIANKIEKLLAKPKDILEALPVLPTSLTKIIKQLNDDEFNTEELIALIQQDPAIAAKVIELANSSFYNHSHKEITDIKSAFMLLGANGLMEGVINGFVSKLMPKSKVYFQQYGNKIWQHCFTTGVIAKELITNSSYKQESAQGYLIGLICNLGDMIIFQLLMDAFSFVHPDCQPNSFAFKDLMYKNSKKITYFIAKHWGFPSSILDVLALQVKLTKSSMLQPMFTKRPIACYLYEANIISELEQRFEHCEIDEDTVNEVRSFLVFSDEARQYLDKLLETS